MSNLVLIADDDDSLRQILAATLQRAGYETLKARNGAETLACVKETNVDVILLDIWLGDANGIELIEDIQGHNSTASIIIITAHGTTQTAIDAAKQRAYGYLTKPIDQRNLLDLVSRAADASNQTKNVKTSTASIDVEGQGKMVGQSPAMQEVYHKIGRAAVSDETVLVLGESGTGKELVAQLIHQNSDRTDNPFVVVDCGAMPSSLIESALFGHVKGAYTDAHTARKGKFQQADSGTIFLDEISELPIEVQMKLLHVLQEREVEPMGGTETHAVNVRIIAATNRRLETAIEQKAFREDLYYRLNVIPISLPPLRERKEDIPELIDLFTRRFVEEYQLPEHFDPILEESSPASEPGNLDAQIYNLLQAHVQHYMESETSPDDLYAEIRAIFEKPLFKIVLEHTKGNRSKASDILGINRNTLHTKLAEHNLAS